MIVHYSIVKIPDIFCDGHHNKSLVVWKTDIKIIIVPNKLNLSHYRKKPGGNKDPEWFYKGQMILFS